MPKTTVSLDTPLREQLQRLAAFEPQGVPVVSLYLDLTANQHGRDTSETFCRKAFAEREKAFGEASAELASFQRDVERINAYLSNDVNRRSNGLVLFSSSGAGEFFEAVQLEAPVGEQALFTGEVPHIYPLVRLIDQYPRYAAVLLDTRQARILVFALGAVEKREQVTSEKTRRHSMGGWSQARYQRHVENIHLHHVKEVVEVLDRAVREDSIQHIIVSGDEVAVPLLKEALPAHLADKVADTVKIDRTAGENEILEATLEALRQKDAETDSERVQEVVDAWQAGGLGVVGPEAALTALEMGQVEELLIAASPGELKPVQTLPGDAAAAPVTAETSPGDQTGGRQLQLSDELVRRAHQSAAVVRMIEDPELLRKHGGVAAKLRFRI